MSEEEEHAPAPTSEDFFLEELAEEEKELVEKTKREILSLTMAFAEEDDEEKIGNESPPEEEERRWSMEPQLIAKEEKRKKGQESVCVKRQFIAEGNVLHIHQDNNFVESPDCNYMDKHYHHLLYSYLRTQRAVLLVPIGTDFNAKFSRYGDIHQFATIREVEHEYIKISVKSNRGVELFTLFWGPDQSSYVTKRDPKVISEICLGIRGACWIGVDTWECYNRRFLDEYQDYRNYEITKPMTHEAREAFDVHVLFWNGALFDILRDYFFNDYYFSAAYIGCFPHIADPIGRHLVNTKYLLNLPPYRSVQNHAAMKEEYHFPLLTHSDADDEEE